jgi:hypothetical protein
MVVWREESLLIISVPHDAILLERAAVAHATFLADLAMRGLGHLFLDAGERGFVSFVRRFPDGSHI